ncbi:unnamed protein product [Gongylonema pulchrum]|uniref:C2H2-type domain-containing protein n=1 Tax=Gongylonema pulchrum TaxID=637853 RepID=A0A183EYL4_9BILA|nr:unnamed protein product [Gongylonema pulchrum]
MDDTKKRRQKAETKRAERKHACPNCAARFPFPNKLRLHIKSHHSCKSTNYSCYTLLFAVVFGHLREFRYDLQWNINVVPRYLEDVNFALQHLKITLFFGYILLFAVVSRHLREFRYDLQWNINVVPRYLEDVNVLRHNT